MNKNFLKLFTLFIFTFLVLGFLYLYVTFYRSGSSPEYLGYVRHSSEPISTSGINRSQEQNAKFDTCLVTDKIEYYYYQQPLDNEKANNKFGLYVYAENRDFIKKAAELVNSNGGDWGYVLLPYNIRDRDRKKWAGVFDLLYEKRLIPIVQLYDLKIGTYEKDTKNAAEFLDSFIWPVRQRYISVYNETNSGAFWGSDPDPARYAEVLDYTIDTFRKQNPDFFMMNGAFNVSATPSSNYIDSFDYMTQMNKAVPGIFSKLDGWASHPYPQPNFAGNPYTRGRNGIRAYESELSHLYDNLGVTNELPVFITETGWAHAEGESNYNSSFLPVEQVARYFKIAYEEIWLPDDRVVAVTPFTIWYNPPFDHFAWLNSDKVPYKHFETVQKMKKVKGNPEKLIIDNMKVLNCDEPQ